MTKSFNKFKKPCFWPISQILGQKNLESLPENLALSRTTSYGFLALWQNSRKTNDIIPRKHLGRRMDERTKDGRTKDGGGGQTLFYRTLPVTAGVPIKFKKQSFHCKILEKKNLLHSKIVKSWKQGKNELSIIFSGDKDAFSIHTFRSISLFKGTLMQIWKSHYMIAFI